MLRLCRTGPFALQIDLTHQKSTYCTTLQLSSGQYCTTLTRNIRAICDACYDTGYLVCTSYYTSYVALFD